MSTVDCKCAPGVPPTVVGTTTEVMLMILVSLYISVDRKCKSVRPVQFCHETVQMCSFGSCGSGG